MPWRTLEESDLDAETFDALLANEIPLIRLPHFLSSDECDAFAGAVEALKDSMTMYAGTGAAAGFFGVSQYQYRQGDGDKDGYFAAVAPTKKQLSALFAATVDPLTRLRDVLATLGMSIAAATEDGYGEYFPCIIRFATGGLFRHYDYAPFNTPGWSIAEIDAQLTWNLYIQEALSGGQTVVYNWPASACAPGDENAKMGVLDDDARDDVATVRFRPTMGDIVFFNSRNAHQVVRGKASDSHNRISIGSFIGRRPDGHLVTWG
jgi:hypothetical protein